MRRLLSIAAAGAVYVALNLVTEHMSFPGLQVVRPGIVVPVVSGVLLGPIAGFLVGFLGSMASDLLTSGFYWNWELGNGLIGLVAGLTPLLASRVRRQWIRIAAAAAVSAVAIVLGAGLAAMTDVFVANLTLDTALSAEWIPLATWNLAWGLPLLVLLLVVWAVIRRRVAP